MQNGDGLWEIPGLSIPENKGANTSDLSELNALFNGTAITLFDNSVLLRNPKGRTHSLRLPEVSVSYRENNIFASGKVKQEEGGITLLSFSYEGYGVLTQNAINGTLYLEARSSEFLDRFLSSYEWDAVSVQDIDASVRMWLSFEGLNVNSVQGDIQVRKLNWKSSEKSLPPILNAAMGFQWAKNDQEDSFLLKGLGFSWAGKECQKLDLNILHQTLKTEITL